MRRSALLLLLSLAACAQGGASGGTASGPAGATLTAAPADSTTPMGQTEREAMLAARLPASIGIFTRAGPDGRTPSGSGAPSALTVRYTATLGWATVLIYHRDNPAPTGAAVQERDAAVRELMAVAVLRGQGSMHRLSNFTVVVSSRPDLPVECGDVTMPEGPLVRREIACVGLVEGAVVKVRVTGYHDEPSAQTARDTMGLLSLRAVTAAAGPMVPATASAGAPVETTPSTMPLGKPAPLPPQAPRALPPTIGVGRRT